jgi:sugar phosphate isomerase/epimerase
MAFRLGIITDEISDDLERALDLARQWGLTLVELRTMWGKNVVDLTPSEVERVKRALRERRLTVDCISSPLFKVPLREGEPAPAGPSYFAPDTGPDRQLEVLERATAVARRLGAGTVRTFSFWRRPWREDEQAEIVRHLRRAVEAAAAGGCVLALENESTCNAATGHEAATLITAVDLPTFRIIWDPGNAHSAGEAAYPDGYRAVRGAIANVHVKDCVRSSAPGEEPFRLLGEGEVDWHGQLAALSADGYDGPLTLEPHPIRPYDREEASYRCLVNLRAMLADVERGLA